MSSGGVHESRIMFMPLCCVVNPQEMLEKYRREAFIDVIQTPPPIVGPEGRYHFSQKMTIETQFVLKL